MSHSICLPDTWRASSCMAKKLVVAIDCDDVLLPSTIRIVERYNTLYQTAVELEHAHSSAYPGWNADRGTIHGRILEIQSSPEYAGTPPFEDAVTAVHRLATEYELHLVTARPVAVMAVTNGMIESHFGKCFASVEHVGLDGSKGEICRRIGADVLVDDNLKHLVDAASYGVIHGLWFGEYPWQQNDSSDIAIRCADWAAVEKEIAYIAKR